MWIRNKKISVSKFAVIEDGNWDLTAIIKDLETKKMYLEAYSRGDNIKLENIIEFEEGSGKENTVCGNPTWFYGRKQCRNTTGPTAE